MDEKPESIERRAEAAEVNGDITRALGIREALLLALQKQQGDPSVATDQQKVKIGELVLSLAVRDQRAAATALQQSTSSSSATAATSGEHSKHRSGSRQRNGSAAADPRLHLFQNERSQLAEGSVCGSLSLQGLLAFADRLLCKGNVLPETYHSSACVAVRARLQLQLAAVLYRQKRPRAAVPMVQEALKSLLAMDLTEPHKEGGEEEDQERDSNADDEVCLQEKDPASPSAVTHTDCGRSDVDDSLDDSCSAGERHAGAQQATTATAAKASTSSALHCSIDVTMGFTSLCTLLSASGRHKEALVAAFCALHTAIRYEAVVAHNDPLVGLEREQKEEQQQRQLLRDEDPDADYNTKKNNECDDEGTPLPQHGRYIAPLLAACYHNIGSEQEHLSLPELALQSYGMGLHLSRQAHGTDHPLTERLFERYCSVFHAVNYKHFYDDGHRPGEPSQQQPSVTGGGGVDSKQKGKRSTSAAAVRGAGMTDASVEPTSTAASAQLLRRLNASYLASQRHARAHRREEALQRAILSTAADPLESTTTTSSSSAATTSHQHGASMTTVSPHNHHHHATTHNNLSLGLSFRNHDHVPSHYRAATPSTSRMTVGAQPLTRAAQRAFAAAYAPPIAVADAVDLVLKKREQHRQRQAADAFVAKKRQDRKERDDEQFLQLMQSQSRKAALEPSHYFWVESVQLLSAEKSRVR